MLNESGVQRAVMDVANTLFELGVIESNNENIEMDNDIRQELGLDSQELMTLVDIVSSLALSAAPLDEENVTTLSDLVDYLKEHRDVWLHNDVPFVLQGSTIISQDIDTVFSYISNYQKWPEILAHVTKIEKDMDDGRLQSFIMHIEELGTKQDYFVKSWRYVNDEHRIIDFSQPLPPKGFRCHKGGWRFHPLADGRTRLISYHGFSLHDGAQADDAIALIRKHIHAALSTWARFGNGECNV
ncbi:SRPBCC family protein [Serratia ureilytica]|uniref:SRPBCC family protein n=1 Tax=Serratia ureilytica TaxID=300181 RepID=UPI001D1808D7|nr:SRPBCC family protein [Serratia ureilytica]MCC4107180.1 SRPBCC family protein [Serratia ureilytica]